MFFQLDLQLHDLARQPVAFIRQNALTQLHSAEVDALLQDGGVFLHAGR